MASVYKMPERIDMAKWTVLVTVLALWSSTEASLPDATGNIDYSELQLQHFKEKTPGTVGGVLSISNGAPVEFNDAVSSINDVLLRNEFFVESLAHLARERLPERFVHQKGAGAFGYFEVTHDLSHICKAKFLNAIGKSTPIAVRFSVTLSERGNPDTVRDTRGFAVKFYTKEGNFDIAGLSTPMFGIKDPVMFHTAIHALKKNPVTNLRDHNTQWDFNTLRSEALHQVIQVSADRGIPDGYRFMPGFSIHTYEIKNENDTSHFVRFHILPDTGIKTMNSSEGVRLSGVDPDYAIRDLYNAIYRGDFPTWTVFVQILTLEDVKKSNNLHFDVTRTIPLDEFPLHQVGKLILNRNPLNHYAEVEQIAFCPSNLVPGILGAPDKLFEARSFAYKDAQRYRMGTNFNKIKVNCPLMTVWTNNRDGVAPELDNELDSPNYYPNTFNGAAPISTTKAPKPLKIVQSDTVDNFDQAGKFYRNGMSAEEGERMIGNIFGNLAGAVPELQDKAVELFRQIDHNLGDELEDKLRTNNFTVAHIGPLNL